MISVIIPIYNVSKYLCKCVDSVLAQTYKDIETILVDDGTPDDCACICDEYLLDNSNFIAVHKPNGGLSDARNKGLDIAGGEYINFLDSDDYVLPEMLEKMFDRMQNTNADMCLCGYNSVDEAGNIIRKQTYKDCTLTKNQALEMLVQGNANFIVAWAKIYKKKIFNNLRFAYGKIHEDEFAAHKVLTECETVTSISEPLYMYLQRTGSIINAKKNKKWYNSVEAYLDRVIFLHEKGYELFSAIVITQAIPLLISINKCFSKEEIAAKKEGKRLKKEIIKLLKIVDCGKLPLTAKIGIFAYKISDSIYLFWRKIYGFLHK